MSTIKNQNILTNYKTLIKRIKWSIYVTCALLLISILIFIFVQHNTKLQIQHNNDDASTNINNAPQIFITNPEISHIDKQGRKLKIKASQGNNIQKTTYHLHNIQFLYIPSDASNWLFGTSNDAIIDQPKNTIQFLTKTQFFYSPGYELYSDNLTYDYKTGIGITNSHVSIVGKHLNIEANNVEISEYGQHIMFKGHVNTTFFNAN